MATALTWSQALEGTSCPVPEFCNFWIPAGSGSVWFDTGAVRAPQQGRKEGRRGGRDRGEVWVVLPIFSSHLMRLRTTSFVPLAIPLCNAPGPLSEASSEPGGPCPPSSLWTRPALLPETLGVCSGVFATWERWFSTQAGAAKRERETGARVVHPTLACICHPRCGLAWGLRLQSQCESCRRQLWGCRDEPRAGCAPWMGPGLQKNCLLRPPAPPLPSVVNLNNGPMLTVP